MPQVINTNVASLNAQRNLDRSQSDLRTSLQRLSSGLRINSAKDDAAGLAISERFTSQIRGLNQAIRNSNDGISLAQTAESALSESGNILQRIRELALQSANATNSASDREALQSEVNQLQSELNRIASNTTFNGLKILDGSFNAQQFQVGANANETIQVSIEGVSAEDLASYTVAGANTTDSQGTGSAAAAANDISGGNAVASQNLTVNYSGGSEVVAVAADASASEIAAQVNNVSGTTGVTADASTTATIDSLTNDGTVSFTLSTDGGTTVSISAAVTTGDLSALADAINDSSGTTGLVATLNSAGDSIELNQADGEDIEILNFANSGGGTIDVGGAQDGTAVSLTSGGTDSTVVAGEVTFTSNETFSVASSVATGAGSVLAVAANTAVGASQNTVASIDISSITGANDAIDIVDAALSTVSGVRADLGAVQNRFESTIANLQSTSEAASASRSRIMDADFAAETAALTRAQILQQAGTSVLAQANTLPQNVLSLLQ